MQKLSEYSQISLSAILEDGAEVLCAGRIVKGKGQEGWIFVCPNPVGSIVGIKERSIGKDDVVCFSGIPHRVGVVVTVIGGRAWVRWESNQYLPVEDRIENVAKLVRVK